MNINNIINKYKYTGALANFLTILYPEFVKYFGEDKEPIIYEALLNTPIVSCNNVYDALKERGLIEERLDGVVKEGDLKRAAGIYQSVPNIIYDNSTNTYKIIDIKRLVAINTLDFDTIYSKTVLIHELAHLIKSYYQEYFIQDDVIISRSGFITTKEKLTVKDNKVERTFILEESVGLEEGLTSVVEEDITRTLIDHNYKVSGYGVVNSIARILTDDYNLKEVILDSQVFNKKEEAISNFDKLLPNLYERLNIIMEELYTLSLKMFSEIFNTEKMLETSNLINQKIKEELLPLLEKIKENKRKEGR